MKTDVSFNGITFADTAKHFYFICIHYDDSFVLYNLQKVAIQTMLEIIFTISITIQERRLHCRLYAIINQNYCRRHKYLDSYNLHIAEFAS